MATDKEAQLRDWLREGARIAIGYSGGVDSAYLAAVAVDALGAANVLAVTGRSASYPGEPVDRGARNGARDRVRVVEIDTARARRSELRGESDQSLLLLQDGAVVARVPAARARGMHVVVDGTNADDLHGHRPGAQAALERGVVSPLAMFGFTKAEIRARSRALGLPTWEQPSSPCLSSRIPYGTPVTVGRLRRVERAEAAVARLESRATCACAISARPRGSSSRADELRAGRKGSGARRLEARGRARPGTRASRSIRADSGPARSTDSSRARSDAECGCFWRLICRADVRREIAAATAPLRDSAPEHLVGRRVSIAPHAQVPRRTARGDASTTIQAAMAPSRLVTASC